MENATQLLEAYNYTGTYSVHLNPTNLRLNRLYIRVYILWMNLLLLILGPFIVIIILNFKVGRRAKKLFLIVSTEGIRSWELKKHNERLFLSSKFLIGIKDGCLFRS